MSEADAEKQTLAAEVWRRMFGFLMSTREHRDGVLQRLSLSPTDAKALSALQPEDGRTMRALAQEWQCDASNATWMVDRLERRGLAERRNLPSDRRVKLVVLTPLGLETKQALLAGMNQPPAQLVEMNLGALRALDGALQELPFEDWQH